MINKHELPIYICIFLLISQFLWLGHVFKSRQPKKTWEVNRVSVSKSEASVGDEISWTISACKYTDKEYVAVNYVKNIETGDAVLINRIDNLPIRKGECKDIEQKSIIPFHVSPGDSVILVRLTVRDTASELFPPIETSSGTVKIIK